MNHDSADQNASSGTTQETCPVCGARNPDSCTELDTLGTRSLEGEHLEKCPVCGGDYALVVWARGLRMCSLCYENIDQALRVLRHKHRNRLNRILLELDR